MLSPPPSPAYKTTEFINYIKCGLEAATTQYADAVVLVLGDFNQMDVSFLCCDYGLTQLVQHATHGTSIIDKVFVSAPDIFRCVIFQSLIKTKHKAIHIMPCLGQLTDLLSEVSSTKKVHLGYMTCDTITLTGSAILLLTMTGAP